MPDSDALPSEVRPSVLRAAQAGDHRAFTVIVGRYDSRLRALAYHLLGDAHLTDDVLQDVYLKAFLGLPALTTPSALRTWLARITYTTAVDHLRRRSRLVPVAETELELRTGDGPDTVDALAANSRVRGALRRLPVDQRAVVVLVGVQGLEYAQAAEVLGVPPGTVASRLASARKVLRAALRPAPESPDEPTSPETEDRS